MFGNNFPTAITGFSLSYTFTNSSSCASSAASSISCPSTSSVLSLLALVSVGILDSPPFSSLSSSATGMPKNLAISVSSIGAMTKSVGSFNSTEFQSTETTLATPSEPSSASPPSGTNVTSPVQMGIICLSEAQSSSTICESNFEGTYPTLESDFRSTSSA
ncbi:hypothetical protein ACQJBY_056026 [Aegilops geniculata]